jgi:hypothetical protein
MLLKKIKLVKQGGFFRDKMDDYSVTGKSIKRAKYSLCRWETKAVFNLPCESTPNKLQISLYNTPKAVKIHKEGRAIYINGKHYHLLRGVPGLLHDLLDKYGVIYADCKVID